MILCRVWTCNGENLKTWSQNQVAQYTDMFSGLGPFGVVSQHYVCIHYGWVFHCWLCRLLGSHANAKQLNQLKQSLKYNCAAWRQLSSTWNPVRQAFLKRCMRLSSKAMSKSTMMYSGLELHWIVSLVNTCTACCIVLIAWPEEVLSWYSQVCLIWTYWTCVRTIYDTMTWYEYSCDTLAPCINYYLSATGALTTLHIESACWFWLFTVYNPGSLLTELFEWNSSQLTLFLIKTRMQHPDLDTLT